MSYNLKRDTIVIRHVPARGHEAVEVTAVLTVTKNTDTIDSVELRPPTAETKILTVPSVVLQMKHLTSLNMMRCGLRTLHPSIAELTSLNVLYLAYNDLVELPDLSPLEHLHTLTVDYNPIDFDAKASAVHNNALRARESVMLLKKKFHYGGVKAAIVTLQCIWKYTSIMKAVNRDAFFHILRRVWNSRFSDVWKRANKRVWDMENYHCEWPVPFVTCYGPSAFACHCGKAVFGDPHAIDVNDYAALAKVQHARNKHFVECYDSSSDGGCTQNSKHFKLNRAVQEVLSRRFHDKDEFSVDMMAALKAYLLEKTAVINPPAYAYHTWKPPTGKFRLHFWSMIEEDVELCIKDFLQIRKK